MENVTNASSKMYEELKVVSNLTGRSVEEITRKKTITEIEEYLSIYKNEQGELTIFDGEIISEGKEPVVVVDTCTMFGKPHYKVVKKDGRILKIPAKDIKIKKGCM